MKTIKLFTNQIITHLNHNHMTLHLRSLLVIILFVAGGSLWAQVGIGTQTPNDNAALEIKSPDKGLLIPQIDIETNDFLSSGTAAENGMFVYHTGSTDMEEGLYVYQYDSDSSSGSWVKFATDGESAAIAAGTTNNATLRWNSTDSKWEEDGLKVISDGKQLLAVPL